MSHHKHGKRTRNTRSKVITSRGKRRFVVYFADGSKAFYGKRGQLGIFA